MCKLSIHLAQIRYFHKSTFAPPTTLLPSILAPLITPLEKLYLHILYLYCLYLYCLYFCSKQLPFPPFPLCSIPSILALPVTLLTSHRLFRHHTETNTTHTMIQPPMKLMVMKEIITCMMIMRFAIGHKLQWGSLIIAWFVLSPWQF